MVSKPLALALGWVLIFASKLQADFARLTFALLLKGRLAAVVGMSSCLLLCF